jgi:prevent-host-death family protein
MAVKIADLKNNLSRHLARVRRGSEITVYDRNTPVARILPYRAGDGRTATGPGAAADEATERVALLAKQGVLSAGRPEAVSEWVEAHAPIRRPARSPGAVDTLLKMRRESRR